VSFYVKANANATYGVELEDGDNSRFNSQSFAVTTNWTRVTKTFVADTTGSLDDDNALSLSLNIWLHGGSDYSGGTFSSNTWHTTTNQRMVDSQTSFFDSTDRTFFITGLQMEVGEQATPFEHRSFGEELALCQRYYYHTYSYGSPAGTTFNQDYEAPIIIIGTGNHGMGVCNAVYPVEMRASPTVSFYGSDGTANRIRYWNSGSLSTYGTVNRSTRQILGMSFDAGTNTEDFYSAALVCDAEL